MPGRPPTQGRSHSSATAGALNRRHRMSRCDARAARCSTVGSFAAGGPFGGADEQKFHWRPVAGTHSLDWDESVKIAGADPDFHRRDLWEAIEAGAFPEWELSFQIFSEKQAESFSFDVLDATKLVPEELVPLIPVGNPDSSSELALSRQHEPGRGAGCPG